MNDEVTPKRAAELADEAEKRAATAQFEQRKPRAKKKKKKEPTQAEIMVALVDDVELFHTSEGECFATFDFSKYLATFPIQSRGFKLLLLRAYWEQEKAAPNRESQAVALGQIEGIALHEGPEKKVHTRLGYENGNLYLDMGDPEFTTIEISPEDWSILTKCPIKFRRSKATLPLPGPTTGGSLEPLRTLLNSHPREGVNEEDGPDDLFIMDTGWLLGFFHPRGPYPIAVDFGEQGSAKSTRQRIKRMIVDPARAALRGSPSDEHDLVIAARNARIVSIDNISKLGDWLSDSLCRLATGAGLTTRKLFSDTDEIIFDGCHPVMMNGIENVLHKSDLVSRAIICNIPRIEPKDRMRERDLDALLKKEHPGVLGKLLDVVVVCLRNLDVDSGRRELVRMADFEDWVIGGESALGWEPGTFAAAYKRNMAGAIDVTLEADPVASAIIQLMADKTEWEGSPTQLYADLEEVTDEKVRKLHEWPKASNVLTRRLTAPATNLRKIGIEIDKGRSRNRMIRITKEVVQVSENTDATDATDETQIQPDLYVDGKVDATVDGVHGSDGIDAEPTQRKDKPSKTVVGSVGIDGISPLLTDKNIQPFPDPVNPPRFQKEEDPDQDHEGPEDQGWEH